MEYNIRAYVDELFQSAPRTQKAYELKVELTQNLLDKYRALVEEGKSPEDAYNVTVMSIGDVRELFAGLEDTPQQYQPVYYPPADDAKKRAVLTVFSIMLYIMCPVPIIVLSTLFPYSDGAPVLGVAAMFFLIALATGLLVYNHMTKPKKGAAPATVVEDFRQWQDQSVSKKQLLKSIRAAFWPLVLAAYFLLSFGTGKWYITWVIFLIAPAVDRIITAALTLSDKER